MPRRLALFASVAACLIAFALALPAQGEPAAVDYPYDNRLDPVYLLSSYYNAINLRDYARAYGYWQNPPRGETLAQFTQGFADTVNVQGLVKMPEYVGAAAGTAYAYMPTLLLATRTNGTLQYYSGCFVARQSGGAGDLNWRLSSAALRAVASADLTRLVGACDLEGSLYEPYVSTLDPLDMLVSYFSALALRDYARAYGYWENAPGGTTLQTFTQGYAQTVDVGLYVRLSFHSEGAAGSTYATIPALVTSTLSNGTPQWFAGCYTLRRSNVVVGNATAPDPNWRLNASQIRQFGSLNTALAAVWGACAV